MPAGNASSVERAITSLTVDIGEAELVAEIQARRSDLAARLVPLGARRALFPHEIAARTNFATIDEDVAAAASVLRRRLGEDRAAFLARLAADLAAVAEQPGPLPANLRIVLRVFDLDGPTGLAAVEGARPLLEDAARFHRGVLDHTARVGAESVAGEAVDQGVAVDDGLALKLDPDQADHLDVLARRLAQAPHVDLVRALREWAAVEPLGLVTPSELVDRLIATGRGLSDAPVEEVARTAAQQAHGIGRLAGSRALPAPAAVYASELLDSNTCGPCSLADGRSYPSVAGGVADYPNGIYRGCEGGSRCRGTLVFVWPSEAPASR